jgi:hypothetical protein
MRSGQPRALQWKGKDGEEQIIARDKERAVAKEQPEGSQGSGFCLTEIGRVYSSKAVAGVYLRVLRQVGHRLQHAIGAIISLNP